MPQSEKEIAWLLGGIPAHVTWLSILLYFFLYLHFQERVFGGASYPLVVFRFLQIFLALLRYLRRIWIWAFARRAWADARRLLIALYMGGYIEFEDDYTWVFSLNLR